MEKDSKKKKILIVLVVLFILIIPAFLVVLSATWLGRSWIKPEAAEEEKVTEYLTPKQVLTEKIKYQNEFLTIRGELIMADMVCGRKECPEDPCCGCENERDLLIVDTGTSIIGSQEGRMRLLDNEQNSFCQREKNSCQYQCPGWQVGEIYDVRGIFRAEPPPRGTGLKMYLDYYFEVHGSNSVGSLGLMEKLRTLFKDLRELINRSGSGGYYILH